MNLFRILTVTFFSVACFSVNAQEYEINIIGHASSSRPNIGGAVDPEDMSHVVGRVLSSDGNAISGANVVVSNDMFFWGGKSKKNGTYGVGAHFGVHVIEVSAVGYRKYRGEVDMPKDGEIALDIVLEPIFDGIADIKSSGNGVTCNGSNALTMSVNAKHPAYKGKSMLDVLRDMPMFTLGDGKFAVVNNEAIDFYLNGKPFKAPYATALKFFDSIDAAKVKSVRIMSWGSGVTAWVSVSYAE